MVSSPAAKPTSRREAWLDEEDVASACCRAAATAERERERVCVSAFSCHSDLSSCLVVCFWNTSMCAVCVCVCVINIYIYIYLCVCIYVYIQRDGQRMDGRMDGRRDGWLAG